MFVGCKNKSIFLASVFTALTLYSTASIANNGPYLGLDVGVNNFTFKKRVTVSDTFGLAEIISHDSALSGEVYGGYLGYGFELPQNIHLAAEISAEITHVDANHSDSLYPALPGQVPISVKEEVNRTYQFSLMPGYCLFNAALLYLKLGVLTTHIESTSDLDGGILGYTGHFSNYQHGYDLGVGTEIPLTNHWRLRGEYDHKFYPSFTKTAPILNQPPDNLTVASTRYRLSGDAVKVGITYDFA